MAGAAIGIGLFGFSPSLHTGLAATIYCMIGIVLYVLVTGKLVFAGNIELRNTRKRLRAVLDGVESGVITISEKGIVESFNLSAERMFGYAGCGSAGQERQDADAGAFPQRARRLSRKLPAQRRAQGHRQEAGGSGAAQGREGVSHGAGRQ
jgi:PAS domain-containing protein